MLSEAKSRKAGLDARYWMLDAVAWNWCQSEKLKIY
jgi:hypothetical protein